MRKAPVLDTLRLHFPSSLKGNDMSTDYLTLIDRSIRYDADTGEFFWRVSRGSRARRGQPAGTITKEDTLRIGIDGRYFDGRDIAWFLGHGEWPPAPVEHVNGNTLDNCLDNLTLIARPYSR